MAEQGLFHRLTSLFAAKGGPAEVTLTESYHLGTARVRVVHDGAPIRIALQRAGIELLICPETLLQEQGTLPPDQRSFVLTTPDYFNTGINGFLRLNRDGDCLIIGSHDRRQRAIFNYPASMDRRHLSITHDGDALIFKALVSDADIALSAASAEDTSEKLRRWRREKLPRISAILGAPIQPAEPEQALEGLRAVNAILETEAYRPLDDRGMPGGILRLPRELTPVIVGDLHAQVNNLLTLLSQNGFLEALEGGTAALVILGDAVHSETEGRLDEMEDSLLIMDLILRLKLRFPRQVFYIRGNHDSFSDTVFKFGVAQCLMWESSLRRCRGEAYLAEMERFYQGLPYLVMSDDFLACHAAPIKTRFDTDKLVNIHRHPGLVRQLTHNRIRRRNLPAGYTGADVRHFRATLKVADDAPFLVSHSPLDQEHSYWLEPRGIKHHHIVFSANTPWIGAFTRVRGHMIPLSYRCESLLPLINDSPSGNRP